MNWIKNNKPLAAGGGIVGLAVLAFLAFGVFGIQTKFFDDVADEAIPVFDSGAASDNPSDVVDQVATDEMNDFMQQNSTPMEVVADDPMPDMESDEQPGVESETEAAPDTQPAAPVIMTVAEGQFGPRSHPGSGLAKVITDGSEQRFLRFEDFETDNGPDLFVYLTSAPADADAGEFGADGEFVNLGRLTGNVGNQNYEIPVDVDLDRFGTVVVWCQRFSVAFTSADLV